MQNLSSGKSGRRIDFEASDAVRDALATIGRTEDVKFSPDNRRIAIAGYKRNILLVIDVLIAQAPAGASVQLSGFLEVSSADLHAPHGLCFIDDHTLAVANRWGEAPIFGLPREACSNRRYELAPLATIRGDAMHRLESPGSLAASRIGTTRYELLVCNNYADYVTRHVIDCENGIQVPESGILLSRGLGVPDGVAISTDRRWIAISNHNAHCVYIYANVAGLNRESEPCGILRNVNYPHGLLFTPDGNFLLVADAGAPYVNVYARNADGWKGTRTPVSTHRVMDEGVYRRGRTNPQEGGPKGITIDNTASVLATTCDEQTLAFFDLPAMLRVRGTSIDWRKKSLQWRLERLRDRSRRLRGWT